MLAKALPEEGRLLCKKNCTLAILLRKQIGGIQKNLESNKNFSTPLNPPQCLTPDGSEDSGVEIKIFLSFYFLGV